MHRVIALENGMIRTKGDNSEEPDSWIKPSQVVGKHLLTIPYAGIILNEIDSTSGFVLLILVPAALIIYNEGRKIKRELGNRG